MAELDLALVFTPDPWVEELHRHLADHGGARVLHLVVDPAMVLHEPFDVLVASWRWPALTPGFVAEVHGLGRAVLGVADRDERGADDVLRNCGVDAVVLSDAAPWEYLDALALIEASWAENPGARAPRADAGATTSASNDRRANPWIAVCGPAGAGRTEIAIELACALGAVLVDADEVAPAVAPRLGLPLEPNVRVAIDAVEFGEGYVSDALQRVPGLARPALCALPSSSAWLDVRPTELLRVLHECCTGALLVIDTAPMLDDVGSPLRGRYALARAIVAEADTVVAVGTATPLGVVRLLGWLADAERLRPRRPAHVLLNRGSGGAFRRAELANELLRSYRPCSLAHIPDDERVRAAGWNGALVARGPFTKAIALAATSLVDRADRLSEGDHDREAVAS
ncbi:MAG TPA: hypothetical protein VGI86_17195 [Acidimicrobiia bacterium]